MPSKRRDTSCLGSLLLEPCIDCLTRLGPIGPPNSYSYYYYYYYDDDDYYYDYEYDDDDYYT